MKRLCAIICITLLMAGCSSIGITNVVGNGNVITEERDIEGFTGLQFNTVGQVVLTPGEAGITIEGESNIIAEINTSISDGVLVIATDQNTQVTPSEALIMTISTPDLSRVVLGGAGTVRVEGYDVEEMGVTVSGAGGVTLVDVDVEMLTLNMNGAGTIRTEGGSIATLDAFLTGLGTINTGETPAATVDLGLGGAGEATVWATDVLDVTISGAGNASYYGSPEVTEQITGLGAVTSLGEK